jgi:hypothetical protein
MLVPGHWRRMVHAARACQSLALDGRCPHDALAHEQGLEAWACRHQVGERRGGLGGGGGGGNKVHTNMDTPPTVHGTLGPKRSQRPCPQPPHGTPRTEAGVEVGGHCALQGALLRGGGHQTVLRLGGTISLRKQRVCITVHVEARGHVPGRTTQESWSHTTTTTDHDGTSELEMQSGNELR